VEFAKELFGHVFASLMRNKLRSVLTMAGIAWGVASMVLIVAMGDGFKGGQRDRFRDIGENICIVFNGRTELQPGGRRAGRLIRLNYDDVRAIRANCYLVRIVVAELQTTANAVSPYNSGRFGVLGVEPRYSEIRNIPVDRGRFLVDADNADAARVCVLGDNVRKQLFGDRPVALGAMIDVNGLPFRVVGLTPPKNQNSSYNGLDSDKIFIPYSAMVRDVPPPDDENFHPGLVSDLIYTPASLDQFKAARDQVVRTIARDHNFDPADGGALHIWDTVEDARLVDNIFTSMTVFLACISLVTLTLGGVGVMNIMLVSVTERTREIGLRKAIGATNRRILADFFLEGLILALASGLCGWFGAFGVAAAVNSLPKQEMFAGLPVSGPTTALSFAALAIVAVGSAIWPAWRAAHLTPVEALRYER
jgi:putative ABC transport system permease protein